MHATLTVFVDHRRRLSADYSPEADSYRIASAISEQWDALCDDHKGAPVAVVTQHGNIIDIIAVSWGARHA